MSTAALVARSATRAPESFIFVAGGVKRMRFTPSRMRFTPQLSGALVALLATSAAAANILSHPDYQSCVVNNCADLYVLSHGRRLPIELHPLTRERAWQLRVCGAHGRLTPVCSLRTLHGCSRSVERLLRSPLIPDRSHLRQDAF